MFTVTGTTYNKMEKVWSGPNLKNLYSDEMTLGEAIVRRLITTPGKVIQIMGTTGESLTALEFLKCSMNVAHNILKMGLNCRDIVGLYAQHSVHEATVMMAAFLCGTPVHALFPGFDQKTVISLYENTRPKFIFCDEENYESALSANETLDLKARIVVLTGQVQGVTHISELVQNGAQSLDINAFPCTGLNGSDTAAILCSSGTTGTPKGVMCSHQALLYSNIYHTVTCDSVVLCFSTMYWASGILNLISALLHSSLRIVPEKPYCPEYLLSLVKHYQITHVLCGGNQVAELAFHQSKKHVRESLQSIDTLLCGGAKIPQLVQEKLLDILSDNTKRPGMAVIYGLSEIAGGLSINGGYPYDFQPFSEGKLWPNKRVCIVDKSDQRLGPNECGEILVYSPYTWQGYYQNSETTANAMKGEWFCSGDIGYFDELGFLHVIGREKEMFKWNNFQICPQPIEDVLLRLEGIAEVCVFPIPDMVSENLTACAIVRTPNEKGQELTVEMVNEYAVKNLDSIYLLIGGVYFMDYLPKTGSGKVQRHKVASMIMNMKERNLVHTKSSIDHAVLNVCN